MTLLQAQPRNGTDIERMLDPEMWRELNPTLGVADIERMRGPAMLSPDDSTMRFLKEWIAQEGYFHVPQVGWNLPIPEMADAIVKLTSRGLMAPFCFVYDEFWLIFAKLHPLLSQILGEGYRMLPDFWAWHVEPKSAQSGWQPHRDKGRATLYPDGRPKSLTVWITLTEATPMNGCIYVVPADRDPTYNTEKEGEWKFGLQDVRALPSPAGGLFCWNQAIVHWGSRSTPRAAGPRISLAFEFQRGDVEPMNQPLLAPLTFLNLEQRMTLICKQLVQYKHMYPLTSEMERFANKTLARAT